MPSKPVPKKCICGCGGMTKGGYCLPGHDKRFHDNPQDAEVATLLEAAQHMHDKPRPIKAVPVPEGTKQRDCDSTCLYAFSTACQCKCGGDNHQTGWARFMLLLDEADRGKVDKREVRKEAKLLLRDHAEATAEDELEEEMA